MIILKTPREIALIRKAGRVVAEALSLARRLIRPGVTTGQIDAAIGRLLAERGAASTFKNAPGKVPFPAVSCLSVNEQVVHGIPGERRLNEGDIVTVDTGCRLNGWCADAAITVPVGPVDAVKSRLIEAGRSALDVAIREMQRCRRWSEVAEALGREVESAGFRLVSQLTGHGIGREMHEDPQVSCRYGPDAAEGDFSLQPGLVIAVEPIVTAGKPELVLGADQWTVITADGCPAVCFEHTVAVTHEGVVVLTSPE